MARPLSQGEAVCFDCHSFLGSSAYRAICSPCGRVTFCEDCVVDHSTWHRKTDSNDARRTQEAARWSMLSNGQKMTELVSRNNNTIHEEATLQSNDIVLAMTTHEQELEAEKQRHIHNLASIEQRKRDKLAHAKARFLRESAKATATFEEEVNKLQTTA
jgi:hypothetical protein